MNASKQLRIHLLGNFRITFDDQPIESLQADRYQALLAFLILCAQTPYPRAKVASLFWPDTTDKKAKTNLRRELHRFRQLWPQADQFVQVTAQTLQWQPQFPCWSDVGEFEAQIAQAADGSTLDDKNRYLQQAVELYQGELLPTCYDEWIESQRNRLQQLLMNALTDLSLGLAEAGDYRGAIATTQRLLQLDSLNESGYLFLMKCHVQQGERATALQVYHQCMTLLREEMGIDPSAETRQFYEKLLSDETPLVVPKQPEVLFQQTDLQPAITKPIDTPKNNVQIDWGESPDIQFFCGRSQESAQLRQWIQQDRCRLITVFGMGGMGKTSLAAKVIHELQADFDFIIWRSLRNAPPLNALLDDLVPFISNQQEDTCSINRLVHWLRQSRCLVVLDNMETLYKRGERAGQYREGYENYSELVSVAGQTNHQSCLLLTSREKPAEVATISEANPAVQVLQLEGSPEAALALIEAKQLQGSLEEKERLGDRYGHSPLSLQIISSSIRDIFDGEISLFLEEDTLLFNGARKLLEVQFERLSSLEKTVMTWLAINRDWTTIAELKADIYPSCYKTKLLEALESLCWRSLIQRRGNAYTQQPVIMEYVTDQLIEQVSEELLEPDCFEHEPQTALAVVAYALLKTTAKDFVRESQERFILRAVAEQLREAQPVPAEAILAHLRALQQLQKKTTGYSAGNLINLAWALEMDLKGADLSGLTIYHAYLQDVLLHGVNVSHSIFKETAFNQPLAPICSVAYSPDGSLLATGEGAGRIVVWRTADYRPVLVINEASLSWIMTLDFIHNGKRLVSEGNIGEINVWDVATGNVVGMLTGHGGILWTMQASPTDHLLVGGSFDADVLVWDLDTYKLRYRLTGHTQQINSAVFSPDSQRIASASDDKTLRIWNSQTGELQSVWQCEVAPTSVCFSPDGNRLAIGHDNGTISIWHVQTERADLIFQAHKYEIQAIAFSPCGDYLASGSDDTTTKLWNAQTGQLLRTATVYTSLVWSLKFSPDGQYLAVGSNDHAIRLWEMPKHRLLRTLKGFSGWVNSVQCHPSTSLLAAGSSDRTVRLWNRDTGGLIQTLEGHKDAVSAVAISPCGQQLASSSFDNIINVWNIQTGRHLKTLHGQESSVQFIDFSPNNQLLLSGSFDHTVQLWDITAGSLVKTIDAHNGWVFAARFSPDGQSFASVGIDGVIKLWDIATGDLRIAWESQQGSTLSVAFDADGQRLASSGDDGTIKLWHAETGKLLSLLEGHQGIVWVAEFSPDGRVLASGSDDQTVKLWDTQTGELLQTLDLHRGRVNSVSFASDGQTLASGSADETIRIWRIATGECLRTLMAPRPYEGMNITDVQGLTEAQKDSLKSLGAVEG
ncbi:MAG: BTAD domain-containing putative transcriptional regulator [Cyanobacteria bacterium P01_F01_bin.150]